MAPLESMGLEWVSDEVTDNDLLLAPIPHPTSFGVRAEGRIGHQQLQSRRKGSRQLGERLRTRIEEHSSLRVETGEGRGGWRQGLPGV